MVVPHEKVRTAWWKKRARGAYPVLADSGFSASVKYGVAFQMHIHTDTSDTPGTFLIGKDGVLKWSHIGKGRKSWNDRPTMSTVLEKIKEHKAGE